MHLRMGWLLRSSNGIHHLLGMASRNAVLEFGAKQVVLVWSEEKKREMKQKLQQSLVMTINECKGV